MNRRFVATVLLLLTFAVTVAFWLRAPARDPSVAEPSVAKKATGKTAANGSAVAKLPAATPAPHGSGVVPPALAAELSRLLAIPDPQARMERADARRVPRVARSPRRA